MAKRKRTTRTTRPTRRQPARRRAAARRPEPPREPLLSPEATQQVVGVLLVLLGAVLALALVGAGGPLGESLSTWTRQLLGWVSLILPPVLAWWGWRLARQAGPRRRVVLGIVLILAATAAIAHLWVGGDSWQEALAGRNGGLVGHALTATVTYALGAIGSFLAFLALFSVGAFMARPETTQLESPQPDQPETPPRPRQSATPEPPRPAPRPPQGPAEPEFQPRVVDTAWEQPPLSLLSDASSQAEVGDTANLGTIIETTLANLGITAKVEAVNVGPTVTQFELRPDAGVRTNQIAGLSNDLALALAAHPVRIQAPIPGKSTVGIEVPNRKAATVRLRQLFETPQFKKGGALPFAVGLDVSGNPIVADLATMPHLLVAGATGSGKSIGINSFLVSLLFTHSPKHLRLLLVDPKRVELTMYNDIPHLLAPVVTESAKVVNALKWVVGEMERRYRIFEEERAKNITEYNKAHKKEPLPYIVVVIDELADLMMVAGKTVEASVVRIAQLARATGIHAVIATQRPSTNVITGVIKANFPARMAFTVGSGVDSRVILDTAGAEKLLGKGDMLFNSGAMPAAIRVQGAFVDTVEIKRLTDFLKGKGEPVYDEAVTEAPQGGAPGEGGGESDDALYQQAYREVVTARKASASFLQRRLSIGYARAARLLDELEENGVVGPGEGAKPRQILVSEEPLE